MVFLYQDFPSDLSFFSLFTSYHDFKILKFKHCTFSNPFEEMKIEEMEYKIKVIEITDAEGLDGEKVKRFLEVMAGSGVMKGLLNYQSQRDLSLSAIKCKVVSGSGEDSKL